MTNKAGKLLAIFLLLLIVVFTLSAGCERAEVKRKKVEIKVKNNVEKEAKLRAEEEARKRVEEEARLRAEAEAERKVAGEFIMEAEEADKLSAPAPAPPDLSQIVEDELKKLKVGRILFNPPQEMKVGVKERVEVRIAKTIAENLSAGLRGRGVPQIEEIRVGTFMKVRLTGDNFGIKTLSHEEQPIAGDGFTQWDWDVVPLKSGVQPLLLTVTIRIKIPHDGEEKKDYPVFERQIKVKVNIIYSSINFIKSYWQWIVTTIIGSGIVGWLLNKRKTMREGNRDIKGEE